MTNTNIAVEISFPPHFPQFTKSDLNEKTLRINGGNILISVWIFDWDFEDLKKKKTHLGIKGGNISLDI